jgi:transcriptional regulator with XRE-family HTH domain
MSKNQTVTRAIKAIKFRFNLNQDEIAKKIGTTQTYLSDIMSGRIPLSELYSDKLCSVFGVSKEFLNTGEGDEFVKKEETPQEMISIPKFALDMIQELIRTNASQQQSIAELTEAQKKTLVLLGDSATSADAKEALGA